MPDIDETKPHILITFNEQGFFEASMNGVGPVQAYAACLLFAERLKQTIMDMMVGGDPRLVRPTIRPIDPKIPTRGF